ncbi:phage holin family protein [Arthrobacter frigidicola]|nr:phage holin family protein [Arthrobacter frigidicola]
MSSSASTRGKRSTGSLSLFGILRLFARLTPRQLSDEYSLALEQMKQKGIKAGVAAAFLAVAVVFLVAFAISLLVAGIMGLATIMPAWLAALLVAALFLVLAAIIGLIGVSRFKKALPLLPEDAIRGVRYDIGVLREGRSFDPATLDVKKPKDEQEEAEKAKERKPKEPTPSYEELRGRSGERRIHIAEARDSLGSRLDVKSRFAENREKVKARAAQTRAERAGRKGAPAAGTAATAVEKPVPHTIELKDRWQPLSVLGASLVALAVMVRRLAAK